MLELLNLELDEAKDEILRADLQTFSALKGEACAYQYLIKLITTPRPSIPKE